MMNAEILRQGGVDYQFGVKRFVGRANLYEKALSKFVKDSTIVRIRAAYEAHDAQQLLAGAHEFKGMCGNIGLTTLFEAADALVQMLRSDAYSGEELCVSYGLLCSRYDAVFKAVTAAMEESV